MRLLFDTHVVVNAARNQLSNVDFATSAINAIAEGSGFVSVASLWEIAIKARLGKLDPGMALSQLPDFVELAGLTILDIEVKHVLANVAPEPPTRDPFDRLLLAQCEVEGLFLVTSDRALRDHPLAYKG